MIQDLRVLNPCSQNEAQDIEQALKGDYKHYSKRRKDVLLLPDYRSFRERIENSLFDKMNIESPALKYRFFVPFLMKAELSPGLAFSETLLTFIHIITCKFSTNRMKMLITGPNSNPSIDFFVIILSTKHSHNHLDEPRIDGNYHVHWWQLDLFLTFNTPFLVWNVTISINLEPFCTRWSQGFKT